MSTALLSIAFLALCNALRLACARHGRSAIRRITQPVRRVRACVV